MTRVFAVLEVAAGVAAMFYGLWSMQPSWAWLGLGGLLLADFVDDRLRKRRKDAS